MSSNLISLLMNAMESIRGEAEDKDIYMRTALILLHVAQQHPRGISTAELGKIMDMGPSSIWRNVGILGSGREGISTKAMGLVRAEEDPHVHQRRLVFLTEKGEQLFTRLEARLGGFLNK